MQQQPRSRACFMCGRDNPVGLKMRWFNDTEGGRVRGTVEVPAHFNGYPGVVHGGIVSAILDETSGRALMLEGDFESLFMTVSLTVRFHRPTPTGTPLAASGWVVRKTGRRAQVAAEIALPDGSVSATAEAVVVRPPSDVWTRWEKEREHWHVDSE